MLAKLRRWSCWRLKDSLWMQAIALLNFSIATLASGRVLCRVIGIDNWSALIKFYTGMNHSWITLTLTLWLSFRSSLRQSFQSRLKIRIEDWKSGLKTEDQDWRLKNYVRPKSWYISPCSLHIKHTTYQIPLQRMEWKSAISLCSLFYLSFTTNTYILITTLLLQAIHSNYFIKSGVFVPIVGG